MTNMSLIISALMLVSMSCANRTTFRNTGGIVETITIQSSPADAILRT